MPVKVNGQTYPCHDSAVNALKKNKPDIADPDAYVATIERKQEGLYTLKEDGKVEPTNDPRGDGAVLDDRGQPNIIDYSDQEPLLYALGENSSHEYPGKIIINNESRYVDSNVKRSTIPNAAETGKYSVGADRTQPTLPTGAPLELKKPGHNMHGLNFNDDIQWNESEFGTECNICGLDYNEHTSESGHEFSPAPIQESVSIPSGLVDRKIAGDDEDKGEGEYSYKEMREALLKGDIKNIMQEAVKDWQEQDHPRAPAGTMQGGEFIGKGDMAPTGNSKEDKIARTEFYQPTNVENKQVQTLEEDIVIKTIDANIAKMNKDFDKESALREEVRDLKATQQAQIQDLEDKNRLEGVQVQRALIAKDKAQERIDAAKDGSKAQEKARMDKMGMEFRLDLIRRGSIPDWDVNGKPTNEMAFQQDKEARESSELMAKRTTKTKVSDFDSFKDKPANVKLGQKVDKKHVQMIEKVWNGQIATEDRKLVDTLMIRGSRAGGNVVAGEWKGEGTMELTTHPLLREKDYEETLHHEVAHARFRKVYTEEQRNNWNKAVDNIKPPTKYAQWHLTRYDNYQFSNMRVTAEDKPIVEKNLKALKNLYYEEVHSEVYANLKSPLPQKKLWNKEGLDKATRIYKEMFG